MSFQQSFSSYVMDFAKFISEYPKTDSRKRQAIDELLFIIRNFNVSYGESTFSGPKAMSQVLRLALLNGEICSGCVKGQPSYVSGRISVNMEHIQPEGSTQRVGFFAFANALRMLDALEIPYRIDEVDKQTASTSMVTPSPKVFKEAPLPTNSPWNPPVAPVKAPGAPVKGQGPMSAEAKGSPPPMMAKFDAPDASVKGQRPTPAEAFASPPPMMAAYDPPGAPVKAQGPMSAEARGSPPKMASLEDENNMLKWILWQKEQIEQHKHALEQHQYALEQHQQALFMAHQSYDVQVQQPIEYRGELYYNI